MARLQREGSSFFIHIDARVAIEPFRTALKDFPRSQFIRREAGEWGKLGLVRATLGGLEAICSSDEEFDFIHLLSGHDYPLCSSEQLDHFFNANCGSVFLEFDELPCGRWPGGGLSRIHEYHFGDLQRRRWQIFSRYASRVLNHSVLFKRRWPERLIPYAGSQWWSMPLSVAKKVLEFVRRYPNFLEYHRFTYAPDEIFFHTILLNLGEHVRAKLVNDSLRFVDWENPNPTTPAIMTLADADRLEASGKLFARKFDAVRSSDLMDWLDREAGFNQRATTPAAL